MVEVGPLDEGLRYAMDYEWWLRMAMAGATFARVDGGPVARQRIAAHAKTVSRPEESALEALGVLDRLCWDPELRQKLSISNREFSRRERRTRAHYGLHVCHGYLRQPGKCVEALRWLLRAAALWPPILLRGQWWRLGAARLRLSLGGPRGES